MRPSFSDKRVRKVIGNGMSPYFGLAGLLWMAEYAAFFAVTKTCFPEVDMNSWPFIAIVAPLVILALWVNLIGAMVLFARAFARRKGQTKAVHYLFPSAEAGHPGLANRILLKLAGIRVGGEAEQREQCSANGG
jgi:hypothetical protein